MPINIQQRGYGMSRIPQTNYATATPGNTSAPYNYTPVLVKDQNFANYRPEARDNKGASTGSFYPTEVYTLSHDVENQKELDIDSIMIGRFLLLALGSVVTTQPDAGGNPLVYQHVFKPMDFFASLQLPATSWVERLGGGLNVLYPSNVVRRLRISGDGINRINGNVEFQGSGKRTSPSGLIFAPTASYHIPPLGNFTYFTNSQLGLTVADAVTLANPVPYCADKRVESWAVEIANTLLAEDAYRPCAGDYQTPGDNTSGAIRSEELIGDQDIIEEFVVRLETSSDEYAALMTAKKLDWKITLTGPTISTTYKHTLEIRSELTQYQAIEIQNKNGIAVLRIVPRALYDQANNKIISFTLVNTEASYTV
ncbi:MAG: hypothetical protein AB7U82_33600 [Blastocatellales bacterium]